MPPSVQSSRRRMGLARNTSTRWPPPGYSHDPSNGGSARRAARPSPGRLRRRPEKEQPPAPPTARTANRLSHPPSLPVPTHLLCMETRSAGGSSRPAQAASTELCRPLARRRRQAPAASTRPLLRSWQSDHADLRGRTSACRRLRSPRDPRRGDRVREGAITPRQRAWLLVLGDCASQMAMPASFGLLLLSALVLAAERIAASDRRGPAVGEYQGPDLRCPKTCSEASAILRSRGAGASALEQLWRPGTWPRLAPRMERRSGCATPRPPNAAADGSGGCGLGGRAERPPAALSLNG
jgi:hypothetical protein